MLSNDYDLKPSGIQQISSTDAVVGLFTALGYNTSARQVMTSEALGFAESLTREVVHVERVADQEGELQVFFVELKHLTVALTNLLARAFKNRAGLFLLVLTADYVRLDFVMLETEAPGAGKKSAVRGPQVIVRPRTLT